jgi:CRISPR/Cas system-associated protein endoribonuclease Cas2
MGLDMYLEKCNRKAYGYKNFDIDEIKENNQKLYNEIKPFLVMRGEHIHWESIFEKVGYWRKANAIHNWFVENVQNGIDNCEYYEVQKDKLEELLKICKSIKENNEIANQLLPTQSGFFFGSTEYGEWYFEDIDYTITLLTKVLEETDFDNEMICYISSW